MVWPAWLSRPSASSAADTADAFCKKGGGYTTMVVGWLVNTHLEQGVEGVELRWDAGGFQGAARAGGDAHGRVGVGVLCGDGGGPRMRYNTVVPG